MPSDIGVEGSIGLECWNLTRSIGAENPPNSESRVKLSYGTKNEKLHMSIAYLNGWQRVRRMPGNQSPAFTGHVLYKPNQSTLLNLITFIGNDEPDTLRYYTDIYGQFQLSKQFGVMLGLDIGLQPKGREYSTNNVWYAPVLLARYTPTDKIAVAARAEFYKDRYGLTIPTNTAHGFETYGYSLNFDYWPAKNVLYRIEGRALSSRDKIFRLHNQPSNYNFFITTALALSF